MGSLQVTGKCSLSSKAKALDTSNKQRKSLWGGWVYFRAGRLVNFPMLALTTVFNCLKDITRDSRGWIS